ncbi:hypothetical protein BDF22DRAFT_691642 [Syncephalis plumigaleata]|nr:hypothetical protein BDF22DRAFT_691642 [Syncephalis plumigaleata]
MRFSTASVTLLATVATFAPSIFAATTAVATTAQHCTTTTTANNEAIAAYDPKKLLCAINKYRKQNNRPYLTFYQGLNTVATHHNDLMAGRGELQWQFDDEAPLYDRIKNATGTADWQGTAQLVAQGYPTEEDYAKALSTDSRTKDIFNGNYTHVGLARNDNNNGPWWTQTLTYNAKTKPTSSSALTKQRHINEIV